MKFRAFQLIASITIAKKYIYASNNALFSARWYAINQTFCTYVLLTLCVSFSRYFLKQLFNCELYRMFVLFFLFSRLHSQATVSLHVLKGKFFEEKKIVLRFDV